MSKLIGKEVRSSRKQSGMELLDGRNNPIFIHSELDDYGLSLVEFRVYARLARRCGKAAAYESVPNMAHDFSVSDRTVQRALKLLISACLVSAKLRPGTSTVYTLLPRSDWLPAGSLPALRAEIAKSKKADQMDQVVTSEPGVSGDTRDRGQKPDGDMRAGGVVTQGPGVVVTSGPEEGSPSEGSPMKVLPHTRLRAVGAPGGSVCADAFPHRTYERYARNHPAEIRNPSGWASVARRTREWDEPVAHWCAEHGIDTFTGEPVEETQKGPDGDAVSGAPVVDVAECPDCGGRGFYYPDGYEKGVTKCRHARLPKKVA